MSYSFLDLAYEVLKATSRPLSYREIWEEATHSGLDKKVGSNGSTPWSTLSAQLSSEILYKPNPRFMKVGRNPQRYFLKSREQETLGKLRTIKLDDQPVVEKTSYQEKDLHPLLAYFVHSSPNFLGEKQIHTKTIAHQKTKTRKNTLAQWLHPDMAGIYFPFGDLEENVIELSKSLSSNSIQVFSFELKKSINTSNYRECFFQTVSNSSWAHEGYLVVAEISTGDELHNELERLSNAFGIGIIHLNVADIDSSRILFRATNKSELDWDTISKLCSNKDFEAFINRLNTDFNAGQVHRAEYDAIPNDPVQYIRTELKVETTQ